METKRSVQDGMRQKKKEKKKIDFSQGYFLMDYLLTDEAIHHSLNV